MSKVTPKKKAIKAPKREEKSSNFLVDLKTKQQTLTKGWSNFVDEVCQLLREEKYRPLYSHLYANSTKDPLIEDAYGRHRQLMDVINHIFDSSYDDFPESLERLETLMLEINGFGVIGHGDTGLVPKLATQVKTVKELRGKLRTFRHLFEEATSVPDLLHVEPTRGTEEATTLSIWDIMLLDLKEKLDFKVSEIEAILKLDY